MAQHQKLVVKVGTSTLTGGTPYLNRQRMLEVTQQLARLHQRGVNPILVTSGAKAAGAERLKFPDLGRSLPSKQMLSAVGQSRLMHHYSEMFDIFDIVVAQVLLTREDLSHRTRYLNARDTLTMLIEQRIVPIVNENDTVATNEIRVGDNDNLSAMVAATVDADMLVILTDQPGLYTADPRTSPDAQLIHEVQRIDETIAALAGGTGTRLGTGGMATKIEAAQIATRSGIPTVIASSTEPDVLARILKGERIGTRFVPATTPLESRKRWLLTDKPKGEIHIDAGAVRVLMNGKASLLPVGMTRVVGRFARGETVAIRTPDGEELGHGMSNYHHNDLRQICGVKSGRINDILGYTYGDYVIHRNNMVIMS